MSIIKITPSKKKPDLKVEYLGNEYVLPGNISAALLERLMLVQEKNGEEAFLSAFLAEVVPLDFKKALAQEDIVQLVPIWMEHIQGPKDGKSKE